MVFSSLKIRKAWAEIGLGGRNQDAEKCLIWEALCTHMGMSVRSRERHTWTSGESLGCWAIKLQVTPTVRRERKIFEKGVLTNFLLFPRVLEYYKAWTLGKSNRMSRRNEQTKKTWTRFLTFQRPLCLHIMYDSTHRSLHLSSRKLGGKASKGGIPSQGPMAALHPPTQACRWLPRSHPLPLLQGEVRRH